MSPPLVSIVLINWNQPALTADCLRSLLRCSYPAVEIIVVDNGSADDSVPRLRDEFPTITILEAGENLGFTGGNNLGLTHATGEFLLLLNNDTEVAVDFLEPMVAAARANPDVGAMSPRIRFFDHPDTLQYAGAHPTDMRRGRGGWRGWGDQDTGQYTAPEETLAAHGAAFFIRRSAMEQVGMLDEALFIFYEELDWSRRLRDAGWRILFVPGSVVFHKESMTTGKVSPFRTYYMSRNRILFIRRHASRRDTAAFLTWLMVASAPINIARRVRDRRWDLLRAFLEGTSDGIRHPGLGQTGAPTGRNPARQVA